MKPSFKYILALSIAANAILGYLFLQPDDLDRRPPWHPFELNSELTLESIVEDGYRFAAMPCGQVQYTKELGDTIIQYQVEVDCKTYTGRYERNWERDLGEPVELDTCRQYEEVVEKKPEDKWKEERAANKYFPWEKNEIKHCYQNIDWRYFYIRLGTTIDSIFIREYIFQNQGYMISETANWNTQSGGNFMVRHYKSRLFFHCSIDNDNYLTPEKNNWIFSITSYIPHLDQKSIRKEKARRKKMAIYYGNSDMMF